MRNFDIFICVKDTDSQLFSTMISRVIRHIKPHKIIIATTENTILKMQKYSDKNIVFLNESAIVNGLNIHSVEVKLASILHAKSAKSAESSVVISRAGWYLQQF